jgi:hypothetical protein
VSPVTGNVTHTEKNKNKKIRNKENKKGERSLSIVLNERRRRNKITEVVGPNLLFFFVFFFNSRFTLNYKCGLS